MRFAIFLSALGYMIYVGGAISSTVWAAAIFTGFAGALLGAVFVALHAEDENQKLLEKWMGAEIHIRELTIALTKARLKDITPAKGKVIDGIAKEVTH